MSQPEGRRDAPKANKLLFINKGLESGPLSRSGMPSEAFKVNSHVQNRRRRRESLNARSSSEARSEDDDSQHPAGTLVGISDIEEFSTIDLKAVIRNFDHQETATLLLTSVHPTNNTLDPFDAAAVLINSRSLQMLQYAFSSFSRQAHRAEALPSQLRKSMI